MKKVTRGDLRRQVKRILRDAEETIAVAQWWNTHRTEHAPIDCEGDRVLADLCRKQLEAIKRNDRALMGRLSKEMLDQANANAQATRGAT